MVLAPMEGVTDAPMRALLTKRGGFSFCVSEFFRVSQDIPRPSAIRRHVPELKDTARTAAGTPVQVQLLGGNAEKMALSALHAWQAGAPAIDLNFGCPAPTVNRHDGGATLLKYPDRIRAIVAAVRKSVPAHVPVSAKLRLGWESTDDIHKNADMAAEGGADWITIHGRTKTQGYKPPAYWEPIGEVRRRLSIPVVANGEIWTPGDLRRCRDATGCEHFMIGRGALANPALPLLLARELGLISTIAAETENICWADIFEEFAGYCFPYSPNGGYALCRIKQWARMASRRGTIDFNERLKHAATVEELLSAMRSSC